MSELTNREIFLKFSRSGILAFLAALILIPASARSQDQVQPITIHAKKYAFEPAEITLKKGETVKLILISDDVAHGLEVKGLKLKSDMPKGKAVEVSVTPDTVRRLSRNVFEALRHGA